MGRPWKSLPCLEEHLGPGEAAEESARDHEAEPLAELLLLPLGTVGVQGTLRNLAWLGHGHMLVAEHP